MKNNNHGTLLVNIVSPSGGGKTTVVKELETLYGYNPIHSYTTRPKRYEGEYGHEFISRFVETTKGIKTPYEFYPNVDMIAYFNSYNTGHHYFILDEQVKRGQVNLYVVDPGGAKQVSEHYADKDVQAITIYIQVDELNRVERLARRGNDDEYIDPEDIPEVWERIEPDKEIFKTVKCDYVIDGNSEVNEVVEAINEIIDQHKRRD